MSEQTPAPDLAVGVGGSAEAEVIRGPGEEIPTLGQDKE